MAFSTDHLLRMCMSVVRCSSEESPPARPLFVLVQLCTRRTHMLATHAARQLAFRRLLRLRAKLGELGRLRRPLLALGLFVGARRRRRRRRQRRRRGRRRTMVVRLRARLALVRVIDVVAETEGAQVSLHRRDGSFAALGVAVEVVAALGVLHARVHHAHRKLAAR